MLPELLVPLLLARSQQLGTGLVSVPLVAWVEGNLPATKRVILAPGLGLVPELWLALVLGGAVAVAKAGAEATDPEVVGYGPQEAPDHLLAPAGELGPHPASELSIRSCIVPLGIELADLPGLSEDAFGADAALLQAEEGVHDRGNLL